METSVGKSYSCDKCEKTFSNNRSLSKHKKVHFAKYAGPYTCDICKKIFLSKCVFDYHRKVHDKAHSCDICKNTFDTKLQLTSHKKTHTGEQFSCEICGKSFRHKNNLTYHIRQKHTGERPYSCNLCDRHYSSSAGLSVHYKSKEHAAEIMEMETNIQSQPNLSTNIIYCEGTDVEVEIKEEEIYVKDPLSIKIEAENCEENIKQEPEYNNCEQTDE